MPVIRLFNGSVNPFSTLPTVYFLPSIVTVSANEPGIQVAKQIGAEWVRYRWWTIRVQFGTAGVSTGQRVVVPQFSEESSGINFRLGSRAIISTSDQQIFFRGLVQGLRMRWLAYHLGPAEGQNDISGEILLE